MGTARDILRFISDVEYIHKGDLEYAWVNSSDVRQQNKYTRCFDDDPDYVPVLRVPHAGGPGSHNDDPYLIVNFNVLEEEHAEELIRVHYWWNDLWYVRADAELSEELERTLDFLTDYPCLDDEAVSAMEFEAVQEWWEDNGTGVWDLRREFDTIEPWSILGTGEILTDRDDFSERVRKALTDGGDLWPDYGMEGLSPIYTAEQTRCIAQRVSDDFLAEWAQEADCITIPGHPTLV